VAFSFAPELGAQRVKTAELHHELQLLEMGVSRDGGPLATDASAGWLSSTVRLRIAEIVREAQAGRPLRFEREVLAAGAEGQVTLSHPGAGQVVERASLASPLEKKRVRFTWIEDEGDWSRCYTGLEGEEEFLRGVDGDAEGLALLPGEPVEIGARWKIGSKALRALLAPGGRLALAPRNATPLARTMQMGAGGEWSAGLEGEGWVVCRSAQRLEVEFSAKGSADATEVYRRGMAAKEELEPKVLLGATAEVEVEGKAVMDWDGGRFAGWKVEGEERVVLRVRKRMGVGGDLAEVEERSRFGGRFTVTVRGEGSRQGH
jgi:hypothetical protein